MNDARNTVDDVELSRSLEEIRHQVVGRGRRLRRRRLVGRGAATIAAGILVVVGITTLSVGRDATPVQVATVDRPGLLDHQPLTFVRIYRGGDDGAAIFVLPEPGTSPRELTTDRTDNDGSPVYSPDGRWIAFQSERDNPLLGIKRVTDIYRMRPDGSDVTRLTATTQPGVGNGVRHPAWSPDGTRIAAAREDATDNSQIVVMGADGSGLVAITVGNGDVGPTWSPDGKWIAYRRRPPVGDEELWVVHPDGTNAHRIVAGIHDSQIAWTPDGRLAFSAAVDDTTIGIFTVGLDGRAPRRVLARPGLEARYPAWTADGTHVVFTIGRAGAGTPTGQTTGRLAVADQRGEIQRFLTDGGPDVQDLAGSLGPRG